MGSSSTGVRVAVLGAGVAGLCTAVCIQREIPGVHVTLIADSVSPYTTTDVAAGIWGPVYLGEENDPGKITYWSSETHSFLHSLWLSEDGPKAGVSMVPCVLLFDQRTGPPPWKDAVYGFKAMGPEELRRLGDRFAEGYEYTTFTCEGCKFLPYLMDMFVSGGGHFLSRKVSRLEELLEGGFQVVVLAPGLEAFNLLGDKACYPIRGQVMRVKAPWIDRCVMDASDTGNYVIPNQNWVVLGGTHQEGDWCTDPYEKDKDFIWKGCCRLVPSLKDAEILEHRVGLRPGRTKVRLEKELVKFPSGRTMQVVHNHGHGGAGITLCWGCAGDATQLVKECLDRNNGNVSVVKSRL